MKKQLQLIAIFIGVALIAHGPWLGEGVLFTSNDMIQQQLPFYLDGWEKFHESGLPMWGFNNLLGVNYLGANSFYFAFSPFFLVTLLFPKVLVPTVMLALNITKLALAATTMSWFLQSLKVKSFWLLVIGGLSYAFSGPLIMNYWFNHFNDFLCLVPLFFIAMEWVIQKRRYWPMSLAVAGAVIINVYFCLGLSVLSWFYFVWRTGLQARKQFFFDWYEWIEQNLRYLGLYVVGLALAAFAFVPTVVVLLGNPRVGASLVTDFNWSDIGQKWLELWHTFVLPPTTMKIHPFLVGTSLGKNGAWQSLSASVNAVILIACVHGAFVWRKRIWVFAFGGVSLLFGLLAFPLTNQLLAGLGNLTYRSLYLVSFFVIVFAIVSLERQPKITWQALLIGSGLLVGLLVSSSLVGYFTLAVDEAGFETFWRILSWNVLPMFGVLILTTGLIAMRTSWRTIACICALVGCGQFMYFIYWSSGKPESFVAASSVTSIMERTTAYDALQNQLGTDEILWRFASDFHNDSSDYFAYNQGLAYQLNTPHIYHSLYQTTSNDLFDFLHGIETPKDAYWQRFWVRSFKYNRLTHWLLGVKYTLLSSPLLDPLPNSNLLMSNDIGEVYTATSQFAKTYTSYLPSKDLNAIPWVLRDTVANEAWLGEVETAQDLPIYTYTHYQAQAETMIALAVALSENITFSNQTLKVSSTALLHIRFDQQSGELYVNNVKDLSIYIDGQPYDSKNDTAHYMQAKTLAIPITPEVKTVSMQLASGSYPLWQNHPGSFQLFFADVDQFQPERVQESLPLYSQNTFQQQLVLEEPSLIMWPISYDFGWSVTSNGQCLPIQNVHGGLIGVELPAGLNELVFRYQTPGLASGIAITVVSTSLLVVVVSVAQWRSKQRRGGYRW